MKLSTIKKITAGCALALATNLAAAADLTALQKNYTTVGQKIIDSVNTNKVVLSDVEANVLSLTKSSVALSQEYAKAHPGGKKLLDFVISKVAIVDGSGNVTGIGPMVDLDFKVIEKDWHDLEVFYRGEASAGVDLEDEDNEHFTDPLHVMIHPIMVLRAARDYSKSSNAEWKDAMKEEMQEGMEQVELTVSSMK